MSSTTVDDLFQAAMFANIYKLAAFILTRAAEDFLDTGTYHRADCAMFNDVPWIDDPCDCDGPTNYRDHLLASAAIATGILNNRTDFTNPTLVAYAFHTLNLLAAPWDHHPDYPNPPQKENQP